MKLKREQFKKILKECIVELVNEGAFDKVIGESLQTSHRGTGTPRPVSNDFVSSDNGDSSYEHGVGQMSPNERLRELSRQTAALTSGNDTKTANMMATIFEDTAKTTLQKTLAAEQSGGGGNQIYMGEEYDQQTAQADKAELEALSSGRGTKHWAALAFGKYNK